MPDKFGVPRPPINVGPELEHWLTQLRITLIRHINHLHGEIAALLVPTGPSGPVLIADLEHIIEDRILGRDTPGLGPVELLTVGSGLSFSGLGGIIVLDGGISNAKLRPSFGLSVIGRPINSLGPPSDIIATATGQVLQRAGATLIWSLLDPAASIGDNTIPFEKLVAMSPGNILGRSLDAGPGPPQENIVGTPLQILSGILDIEDNGIQNIHIRNAVARSVIGRSAATAGSVADIPAILNSNAVLRESAGVIGWGLVGQNNLANNAVGNAQFRGAFGLSVVGNAANAVGNVADIIAAAGGNGVLLERGSTIVWALINATNIAAGAIGNAALRDSIALSVIGRAINSNGPPGDIATTALSNAVLREAGSAIGWGLLGNANIAAAAAIAKTKLENSVGLSVIGVTNTVPAPLADIATTNGSAAVLREAGGSIGWGLLANANISAAAGIAKTKLENSVGISVLGKAAAPNGPPADIVCTSGSSAVLKENGAGVLFFGLINTNNIASNALIPTSKLANSAARSVLGVPGAVAAPPSDIVSTADGQILTRKAGVVGWTAAPTTYTMYQRVYDSPAFWGEATVGTPTLALTSPTAFNQTSGNNHFVGFLMGDAKISWLRFGFTVPADHQVGTGFTPRICFILQSAPAAGNVVELSIVSTLFNDNDNLAAGTGVFGTTNVVITGYAASDYVIVDLNAIGAGLTPGQYYQGVIQRDARGAADTYADLIAVSWISFRGAKVAV